jgi:hypothetical protein
VFSAAEKANELKGVDAKQLEPKRKISPLVTKRTICPARSCIASDDELCCAHQQGLLSSANEPEGLKILINIALIFTSDMCAF